MAHAGKECLSLWPHSAAKGSFPLLPMPASSAMCLLTSAVSEKEVENTTSGWMGTSGRDLEVTPFLWRLIPDAGLTLWGLAVPPSFQMTLWQHSAACNFFVKYNLDLFDTAWNFGPTHCGQREMITSHSFGKSGFFPQLQLLTRAALCIHSPARNSVWSHENCVRIIEGWGESGSKLRFGRHPWCLHCLARSLLPTTMMHF